MATGCVLENKDILHVDGMLVTRLVFVDPFKARCDDGMVHVVLLTRESFGTSVGRFVDDEGNDSCFCRSSLCSFDDGTYI